LAEIFFKKDLSKNGYRCLRYPGSVGLPYLAVIAACKEKDRFDITIGGATKSMYKISGLLRKEIDDSITNKFISKESLLLCKDYLRTVAPSLIRDAMDKALEV